MNKKIVVAAAWPYANGSLHLGHVAALIGADVLARYHRLNGDRVMYVSGSDCHGTPIVLEADKQGVSPESIAKRYHEEFSRTLIDGLGFTYDNYTTTLTQIHSKTVQEIFLRLYNAGHIYTKTEELPYCEKCQRFLPDRYVEGECPICHFDNARGDQCDECGNLMDSRNLIKPRCKTCGSEPVWKPSEHFFLRLSAFQDDIRKWVESSEGWRVNAKNFTLNFLEQGLHDRAITRDTQWGIDIPLEGYETKKIYVWFEAVCGYLTASQELSQKNGKPDEWKEFWQDKEVTHYYVHGKDNIPFHSIIWPTILMANGELNLPSRIYSSEYLALEGRQFSKSRRWAVWLPEFLEKFDSESLRYFLIANGAETSDSNFSWEEFRVRTNSELIGNYGNFVNRTLSIIKKNFPDGVAYPETLSEDAKEYADMAEAAFKAVGDAIEGGHFREGLRQVFKLVEHGNRYINSVEPWKTVKIDPSKAESDLAIIGQVIKCLSVLVKPFLPKGADMIAADIGFDNKSNGWKYPEPQMLVVNDPKPMYKRIEESEVAEQMEKLQK